jgi:hypothetical protein
MECLLSATRDFNPLLIPLCGRPRSLRRTLSVPPVYQIFIYFHECIFCPDLGLKDPSPDVLQNLSFLT